MSDVNVIRLSTGEELIATVEKVDGDVLTIKDVAILIPTQENSLGLAPFMAYTEAPDGLHLKDKDIMFVVKPVEGLKQQYDTMFGKIATPSKKIIV